MFSFEKLLNLFISNNSETKKPVTKCFVTEIALYFLEMRLEALLLRNNHLNANQLSELRYCLYIC